LPLIVVMAEALVVIEDVLPPTVEVKLVILVDKAASALALVVASEAYG
jgi:hypothetical protein